MQQKQVYEGSLQQYNPTSRNKKISNRQPNFTPKTTGKRRTKNSPKLVEGKKSLRSEQEKMKKK